jgi:hypothetical protein
MFLNAIQQSINVSSPFIIKRLVEYIQKPEDYGDRYGIILAVILVVS